MPLSKIFLHEIVHNFPIMGKFNYLKHLSYLGSHNFIQFPFSVGKFQKPYMKTLLENLISIKIGINYDF